MIRTPFVTPIAMIEIGIKRSRTSTLAIRLPLVTRVVPAMVTIPMVVVIPGIVVAQPQVRLAIIKRIVIAVVVIRMTVVAIVM